MFALRLSSYSSFCQSMNTHFVHTLQVNVAHRLKPTKQEQKPRRLSLIGTTLTDDDISKGCRTCVHMIDRLVGLVVKASASRAEDPGFESRLRRDFSRSSHTSDFKIDTPVATLPGAWIYRVSAGTGRPGVSILLLGEVESWIRNFYLSVAACKTA